MLYIDSRLKRWLSGEFGSVSTKYLQKYLNWFRYKELLKQSTNFIEDFTEKSLQSITTIKCYRAINEEFQKISTLQRKSKL